MAICCICEKAVDRWLPHPSREQRSPFTKMMETVGSDLSLFHCPHCACIDRERHLWLYMTAADLPRQLQGTHILHLAPEQALEPLIEACQPARYVRGDLHPTRPQIRRLNAEELPFEDHSFDLIIANHLLEHVGRPDRALAEFNRCLKHGGMLIAQTPYAPYLKHTLELNVPVGPDFATLFYGQADHVRLFGSDLVGLFHAAGLQGELLPHEAALAGLDAQEFGCNVHEPFFCFCKPELMDDVAQAA